MFCFTSLGKDSLVLVQDSQRREAGEITLRSISHVLEAY